MAAKRIMTAMYDRLTLPTATSIRLLRLSYGHNDPQPTYSMEVAEIREAPTYLALSYVWGSDLSPGTIRIGDEEHEITASLEDTLTRVNCSLHLHHDFPKLLWIDQICINQHDTNERNAQVSIMDQIYANAHRVLVDLGISCDAEKASYLIEEMMRRLKYQLDSEVKVDEWPKLTQDEINEYHMLPWPAFRTMMNAQWFRRAWVVQEVGLARHATVLYGESEIRWSSLMILLEWLSEPGFDIHTFYKLTGWTVFQMWISFDVQTRNPFTTFRPYIRTLLDLLGHASYAFKAKDSRDHIYAFLGHPSFKQPQTTGGNSLSIIPDYYNTDSEVYHDFAAQWLETNGASYILSCVHHATLPLFMSQGVDERPIHPTYPSWVPRWNDIPIGGSRLNVEGGFFEGYKHNTSGSSRFEFNRLPGRRLQLKGAIFDNVSAGYCRTDHDMQHGFEAGPSWLSEEAYRTTLALCRMCWSIAQDQSITLDSTFLTAFANTAVARLTQHQGGFDPFTELIACIREARRLHGSEESTPDLLHRRILNDLHESCKDYSGRATKLIGYVAMADTIQEGRVFFTTEDGRIGLGPSVLSRGDVCCVIKGADVPYLLRRVAGSDDFLLVGECYIYGVMDGEVVTQRHGNDANLWKSFVLR